jgi:hypothetical protein
MKKLIAISAIALQLFGANFALAKIDYHGYYWVENDLYNLHYMSELSGYSNMLNLTFDQILSNPQTLANNIRTYNYKGIELTLSVSEGLVTNQGNQRTSYLQAVKQKISVDSDLIKLVAMIHIYEEPYTLLEQGYYNNWTIFSGMDASQKHARMKLGLEQYIADVKTAFPNIPVIIVENFWSNEYSAYIPPSNLDILGLDAYYIPTDSSCDATQRAAFDSQVTNWFNLAKQYGKPIHIVAPVFDDGHFKMLSACQAQWYIDLAKNDPQVVGLDWFLYADVGGVRGIRNNPYGPLAYIKTQSQQILTTANPVIPYSKTAPGDYNTDGKSDFAVFRGSDGNWYFKYASGAIGTAGPFGAVGDIPVPGDYNGDKKADMAFFRPSNSTWYIQSTGATTQWGAANDIPTPGDYDGDGKTDIAIFRPATGVWWILPTNGALYSIALGDVGDIPVPGDYNGDGKTEPAVYRPTNATWYLQPNVTIAWGAAGDWPVPGDYNGDGKTEVAVFRPSEGRWYVQSPYSTTLWGATGDIPTPGDYNGDGKADFATYRPTDGSWWPITGASALWGATTDIPVVNSVTSVIHAMNLVTTATTPTPIVGDINLDHIVNAIDFSILNAHWFTNYASADFNSDGIVNAIDFSKLNSNWFKTW